MYKNSKIFSLLSVLFLMLFSCTSSAPVKEKGNDILSISYRRTVGRGGSESILATKDSLISTASGRLAENSPTVNRKINPADWQKLVSIINIETLKKTVSGEGRGHYDGQDEFYEIKTSDQTFSVVNVQDSAKAKQLYDLKNLLIKLTKGK